jgi:hypothetical protein
MSTIGHVPGLPTLNTLDRVTLRRQEWVQSPVLPDWSKAPALPDWSKVPPLSKWVPQPLAKSATTASRSATEPGNNNRTSLDAETSGVTQRVYEQAAQSDQVEVMSKSDLAHLDPASQPVALAAAPDTAPTSPEEPPRAGSFVDIRA